MQGCTLIQVLAITVNNDKIQKFTLTCTILNTCIQMWIINDEYKTVAFMVYDIVHINESKKYKHFWHSFNVQIPSSENDQE